MVVMQVERITPQLATAYLELNKNNRNIRECIVDAYAREMKAGNWVVQHQDIAFNENGDLVDGQHRLRAVIKAGVPVCMTVTRGLPVECVGGIDQGVKRKFNDILEMQYAHDTEVQLRNPRLVAAIRSTIRHNVNKRLSLTFNEVCYVYRTFKDEFDVVHKVISRGKSSGYSGEIMGAVASALIWGEQKEDIRKWCNVFLYDDIRDCDGLNIVAAINWRRQFDDAKIKHKSVNRDAQVLGTENSIWNFCNNTETKIIRIPKSLKYDIKEKLVKAINF